MTVPVPDAVPVPDLLVTPIALALQECLCAELAESVGGPVCQCCVRPGGLLPPMDSCGCSCGAGNGQASVQVTSIYPTTHRNFPTPGVALEVSACDGGFIWAAQLTLVVYRCIAVADENSFPSCEELEFDALRIWSDAAAMRRAILCCDWNRDDRGDQLRIVPEQWVPVQNQGGCGGGRMSVLVELGGECCPDDRS